MTDLNIPVATPGSRATGLDIPAAVLKELANEFHKFETWADVHAALAAAAPAVPGLLPDFGEGEADSLTTILRGPNLTNGYNIGAFEDSCTIEYRGVDNE